MPPSTVLGPPPNTDDWIEAADIIRTRFSESRSKTELATLAHDVLIALIARNMDAELWSQDQDFQLICQAIGVTLLYH